MHQEVFKGQSRCQGPCMLRRCLIQMAPGGPSGHLRRTANPLPRTLVSQLLRKRSLSRQSLGKQALHSERMCAWLHSPQIPQLGLSATVHLLQSSPFADHLRRWCSIIALRLDPFSARGGTPEITCSQHFGTPAPRTSRNHSSFAPG
jgi:hypothetical protein